jgi:hypothetical protein
MLKISHQPSSSNNEKQLLSQFWVPHFWHLSPVRTSSSHDLHGIHSGPDVTIGAWLEECIVTFEGTRGWRLSGLGLYCLRSLRVSCRNRTTAGEREGQYIHSFSRGSWSHKTIVIGSVKLDPSPTKILNNENKERGGQIVYHWSNST